MLTKSYSKTGKVCRVTFRIPAPSVAETAYVCGEFNGWNPDQTPMRKLKDGGFSATVSLDAGQSYRFRYLLDGGQWETDREADALVPNGFGSEDSVVTV